MLPIFAETKVKSVDVSPNGYQDNEKGAMRLVLDSTLIASQSDVKFWIEKFDKGYVVFGYSKKWADRYPKDADKGLHIFYVIPMAEEVQEYGDKPEWFRKMDVWEFTSKHGPSDMKRTLKIK